jgi:hypothetical protein
VRECDGESGARDDQTHAGGVGDEQGGALQRGSGAGTGDDDGEERPDRAAQRRRRVGHAVGDHGGPGPGDAALPRNVQPQTGQIPAGEQPSAHDGEQDTEDDGEPWQVLLDLTGDGRQDQPEHAEDRNEPDGHRGAVAEAGDADHVDVSRSAGGEGAHVCGLGRAGGAPRWALLH